MSFGSRCSIFIRMRRGVEACETLRSQFISHTPVKSGCDAAVVILYQVCQVRFTPPRRCLAKGPEFPDAGPAPCYHRSVPERVFEGVLPALVTPFREDERIDFGVWQSLIDTQIAAGVHGLFAGGSAGEFASLSNEERRVALRFCRQAAAGRVPVYGNAGAITTRESVDLAQAAQSAGVDVVVVVTPYYIRPSQQELAEHFIEICHAVNLPVVAYNFPLHGGVELAAETLGRIAAACENLVGVKDSSGRLEQALAYLDCAPGRRLAVFEANDSLILPALERGCAGTVTASASLCPKLFVDLYRAHREGRPEEAARLQALAAEVGELHGLHTFPDVVKEAMGMAGIRVGMCRKPIRPMPEEARRRVAATVERLRALGYLPQAGRFQAA
jgi:4-hydroxy-tetrahydrodipicolinate synthase